MYIQTEQDEANLQAILDALEEAGISLSMSDRISSFVGSLMNSEVPKWVVVENGVASFEDDDPEPGVLCVEPSDVQEHGVEGARAVVEATKGSVRIDQLGRLVIEEGHGGKISPAELDELFRASQIVR
jgi:hypothetical protein